LSRLATPAPRKRAVSRTDFLRDRIALPAASYTVRAVSRE